VKVDFVGGLRLSKVLKTQITIVSGTVIRVPPTLLNTAGNHHQHKPQRLMGAVQVKASSTKGRDLAWPEPGLGQEQ
jgi:hypothetical protein